MDTPEKYHVELLKPADKYYNNKLPEHFKNFVDDAKEEIAINPHKGPNHKPLKGKLKGKYSYTFSGYRIIYVIDEASRTVYVQAIGPRGDIYKK